MDRSPHNPDQTDYVAWGSEAHLELLGIRPVRDDDDIVHEGYALMDVTQFGPLATERYIRAVLVSRVSMLKQQPPRIQSEDRTKPGYAPPMVIPPEAERTMPGF